MTDDEDESTAENFSEQSNLIQDPYNYISARENLQEFPGRVPQSKRKKESENPQQEDKPKVRVRKVIFCLTLFRSGKKRITIGPLTTATKKILSNFSPQ